MIFLPMPSSPLRIALLTYSTKLRGSVVHTLELAEALHSVGHRVCVYALSKDGQGFERSPACEVCLIPATTAPSDVDRLIHQRIREFVQFLQDRPLNHDIFHAQDCLSANALVELRRQHRIPHVLRTVHHIEAYRSPYLRQCQDTSIREVDQCLCVSDRWHRELQRHYGLEADRVMNGVNTDLFSTKPTALDAVVQQRWNLDTAPLYLTVGGLEPRKNSLAILRAFAQVHAENPTAKLVVVGGETLFDYQDYRQQCLALIDELQLEDSVVITGVVSTPELAALYRVADAFLFPSLKEGWGLVVLEAIASGLPVITANQAPFTEFLAPDQALLVEPESSAAIAQAMRQVCNLELARSLVQASAPLLSTYTWEISAQQHLRHYRQVLNRILPTQSSALP
jgi:glycosyltransferase-like protein